MRPVPNRPLILWRIEDRRMKHRQVAAFLDVSPAQLSRCLRGDRHFSDDQMDALADLLGIDREFIDLSRSRLAEAV